MRWKVMIEGRDEDLVISAANAEEAIDRTKRAYAPVYTRVRAFEIDHHNRDAWLTLLTHWDNSYWSAASALIVLEAALIALVAATADDRRTVMLVSAVGMGLSVFWSRLLVLKRWFFSQAKARVIAGGITIPSRESMIHSSALLVQLVLPAVAGGAWCGVLVDRYCGLHPGSSFFIGLSFCASLALLALWWENEEAT